MDLEENINTTFKTYLDKAIRLSIVKEKSNGLDFLYVKTLNSLDESIRKQFKKPAKEELKKLVAAQFEISVKTPEGQESYLFYKNEKVREMLVKNGSLEDVRAYLSQVKYKREFLSLVDEFIKSGNMPAVKMMVEDPVNKKQAIKIDYNYCLYAVEANQIEMFDYFRSKAKKGIKSYLSMCASRAIDGLYYELLDHILNLDKKEINKLLLGAIIDSEVEMQSFLVDRGASISHAKKMLPTCESTILELESYRLNLSLQKELSDKPMGRKIKI